MDKANILIIDYAYVEPDLIEPETPATEITLPQSKVSPERSLVAQPR